MVKCLLALLTLASVAHAQLGLSINNALYSGNFTTRRFIDSPTNYQTLGLWILAEDVATNNGATIRTNWASRVGGVNLGLGGTTTYYSNAISSVTNLVAINPAGPITSGFTVTPVLKVGTPTAGNGFTYLLFGRASAQPNGTPFMFKASDSTEQLRVNITATNTIGAFVTAAGTFEVSPGVAFTNAGYKLMFFSYSNNQAVGFQNLVTATLATVGINLTMNTLDTLTGNFDVIEAAVWTNKALNASEYFSLYTNYYKIKYPNANL